MFTSTATYRKTDYFFGEALRKRTSRPKKCTNLNAFGWEMDGRVSANGYRFGFNGKEVDSEFNNRRNHLDYGFRIYNGDLGRFLSVDPLTRSYPWYTPYQFAGNKPIWAIDLDGLEEVLINTYSLNNIPFLAIFNYVESYKRAQTNTADDNTYVLFNNNNVNPSKSDQNKKALYRNDWLPEDVQPIEDISDDGIKRDAQVVADADRNVTLYNSYVPAQVKAQFTVNIDDKKELYKSLTDDEKRSVEVIAVALLKFEDLKATIEGSASSGGDLNKNKALANNRAQAVQEAIIDIVTSVGATESQISSIKERLTIKSSVATGENKVEDQSATISVEGGNEAIKGAVEKYVSENKL